MTLTAPVPEQLQLAAAITGLLLARDHEFQGVRPQGSGQDDFAQAITSRGNPAKLIMEGMQLAQERWPGAERWELVGADVDTWKGAQTYAQFTWPPLESVNQDPPE